MKKEFENLFSRLSEELGIKIAEFQESTYDQDCDRPIYLDTYIERAFLGVSGLFLQTIKNDFLFSYRIDLDEKIDSCGNKVSDDTLRYLYDEIHDYYFECE